MGNFRAYGKFSRRCSLDNRCFKIRDKTGQSNVPICPDIWRGSRRGDTAEKDSSWKFFCRHPVTWLSQRYVIAA